MQTEMEMHIEMEINSKAMTAMWKGTDKEIYDLCNK